MENFVKLCRRHPHHGSLLVDHLFFDHVHCHLESGQTGPLADTALEHPEMSFLDGELDVLHILEVLLKGEADAVKLLVDLRHCALEGLEVLVLLGLGGLVERVRGTDTCNDILTLRIDEPLSVELVVAVGRVA